MNTDSGGALVPATTIAAPSTAVFMFDDPALSGSNGILAPALAMSLNQFTALGDVAYGGVAGAVTRLAGNTVAAPRVLTQTGTGTASAAPAWNATTGTGNVVMSASPGLTGVVTITNNNVGAVSTDAVLLTNGTAAIVNGQQWSGRVHWVAQGWKTNATAGSQTCDWVAEVQPIQGAAHPTNSLVFSYQVPYTTTGAGYLPGFAFEYGANGPVIKLANYLGTYGGLGSIGDDGAATMVVAAAGGMNITATGSGIAVSASAGGGTSVGQAISTGGVSSTLRVSPAAHTALTASSQYTTFSVGSANFTWATGGTVVSQGDTVFNNSTYISAGATTFTNAATVVITGAPVAGAGTTFTNGPYSFWVKSGAVRFDGTLVVAGVLTASVGLSGNVTGNVSGSSGSCTGNAATATLASTVTTNANLTGPIVSVGNATSIASQTGTGTKFVMDAAPTFSTTTLHTGVATFTVQAVFNGGAQMSGNLIFSADATYDIGATGATRPRDLFLSRNAVHGGTFTQTGVATFTAQSVHSAGLQLATGQQMVWATTAAGLINTAAGLVGITNGSTTTYLNLGLSGTLDAQLKMASLGAIDADGGHLYLQAQNAGSLGNSTGGNLYADPGSPTGSNQAGNILLCSVNKSASGGYVGIRTGTPDAPLTLVTTSASPGIQTDIVHFDRIQTTNDNGQYLAFRGGAAGTTLRSLFGMAHTGSGGDTIFTGEVADGSGIRAQGALQLGSGGDHIMMTMDAGATKVAVTSGIIFQLGNNAVTGLTAAVVNALVNSTVVVYDATGTAYRIPAITP